MSKKEYIHYGSKEFDPKLVDKSLEVMRNFEPYDGVGKFNMIKNYGFKPKGLWASPVNAAYGWKEWCESEEFHTERLNSSFRFTLSNKAKILKIRTEKDIMDYLILSDYTKDRIKNDKCLKITKNIKIYTSTSDRFNLSKLAEDYDGIELFLSDNYNSLRYSVFYSWDCDSICIWNKDIINIIEE